MNLRQTEHGTHLPRRIHSASANAMPFSDCSVLPAELQRKDGWKPRRSQQVVLLFFSAMVPACTDCANLEHSEDSKETKS